MSEILQKFIANSGLCSRRKAEEMIIQGKVKVNGNLAEAGMRVNDSDEVRVNGKEISKEDKVYIKLNKPVGYTCTNKIFKGEKNIFELVDIVEKLFAVGRLDKNSRGLVLLTNDGDLGDTLTHPRYGHEKEYLVRVEGMYKDFEINKFINACKAGFEIPEIGKVKMKEMKYLEVNKFRLILAEGKKRQIRRMFEKFGLGVTDLQRVRINTLKLDDLKEGAWKYLTEKEIKDLM